LLPHSDEAWSDLTPLGFTLDFFGTSYTRLYVNTNGNVTFKDPSYVFVPFNLTTKLGIPMLAPFFADVDTRAASSGVVRYGSGTVDGRNAFGASWIDVGYFFKHADKLNSFQLVLIDRSDRHPGDVDVEFNYDRNVWESGDWSTGSANGLGGLSARVGYTNGTGEAGTLFELAGSGVAGAFLDGNPTGLIHQSLNSTVAGRYVFSIGQEPLATIPAPAALVLGGIGAALVRGLRRRRML